MPLDGGLEIAVQEFPGTPLVLRMQTFFPQGTTSANLSVGPAFPEQAAAATVQIFRMQSISIRADVNIFRYVICERIPFELHLGSVMGRLEPDKELDPQLLQFPVGQRKIVGRVRSGSPQRNYPLMDSFQLFQIGHRVMDIPRRHGQADDDSMVTV